MNFKTNQNIFNGLLAGLLLFGVVLACNFGDDTAKANKLVNEGNAAIDEGKKFVADGEAKKNKMLQMPVAQLADARALARDVIKAYDQAEQKAKEASGKFEEASKLKVPDKFKEYLSLKVKEYNKRAELMEALKGTPQALIDSENRASFVNHANESNQKAEGLAKEADDLEAQADKLQKDNPDSIKKT